MSDAPSRKRKFGRIMIGFVLFAVLGWTCLVSFYYWSFTRSPEAIAGVIDRTPMPVFLLLPMKSLWNSARDGSVQPGDAAPAFSLKIQGSEDSVSLASFRGKKPVVLVFGSYT